MICTLHWADCWGVWDDMVGSFNLPDPNLHSTRGPCAACPSPLFTSPSHSTHTYTAGNKKIKQVSSQELRFWPSGKAPPPFPWTQFHQPAQIKAKSKIKLVMHPSVFVAVMGPVGHHIWSIAVVTVVDNTHIHLLSLTRAALNDYFQGKIPVVLFPASPEAVKNKCCCIASSTNSNMIEALVFSHVISMVIQTVPAFSSRGH